ncbi:MAG TPA: DUF401 family protein [Candidatus Avacidaminococcus intestinavium]|uniref:DUF401 family protein n=1 Tax=Candidatus Avacidaminococcus intestinavium TaxID=2840684 RepID=A0A9D1MQ93_9FIRM|nr:DUF401 family protein [Candidatus Avacidaminococcus intestinavium]
MALIIILLRRHYPIGPAILAGGLLIWLLNAPQINHLFDAGYQTLTKPRTYDLLLALYFVMCLEIELRTSGTLSGMIAALQRLFASPKITLAIMPAFLGLLPSLGGARFSAPIVDEASKGTPITAEQKSTINFWFRHAFEYINPINPGMILACSIAMIPISSLIVHMGWLSIFAFAFGWLVCLTPLKVPCERPQNISQAEHRRNIFDVFLCLTPVLVNFLLVVLFDFGAASSMGLVAIGMVLLLRLTYRVVNIKEVFLGAIDRKMLINIICILYFIQLLTVTGTLAEIVDTFQRSPLPIPVIIGSISFVIGVLTGLSQGHAAIVLPVVAALAPGNLDLIALAMIAGIAGQMVTPTHVCLTVTLDYFKADFFKTLKPIVLLELLLVGVFILKTWIL